MTAISNQQKKFTDSSALSAYRDLVMSGGSCADLIYYELVNLLCSSMFGLSGFALRSLLYRPFFKECGARPAVAKNVLIRGGKRTRLGKKVLLDENSVLDARGDQASVSLGDYVSIGRGSLVVAKNAQVELQNGVNVGSSCRIASESKITIGESTLIAAYSYIGPSDHQIEPGSAIIEQDMTNRGGVEIGKNVWIAARCTIMDGVKIGDNAVIGAHSFVKDDVPANSIAVGTPAKVINKT